MSDKDKIAALLLRKDSLEDLCSLLEDPCDGCEVDSNRCPGLDTCGYIEQDGLRLGKVDAVRELKRRQNIIANVLHVWGQG